MIANKYEIVRKLGEGGTGAVYLVRHADIDVFYALKILGAEVCENEKFIEQFKLEASVLQKFSHPGVTQLRDFGRTPEGDYYLAMDYSKGKTLRAILDEEGPYHVQGALEIAIQLLGIVADAHEHGIIHRDLKPCNIMINRDKEKGERVQILDFGTAMLRGSVDVDNTKALASFGTPLYMAPEQASGATNIDHRVDIYSIGIILYQLLTGDVPFEGKDVVQTLLMHVTQVPEPFAERYGLPEYVQTLVFKALEKKPHARYETARDFQKACVKCLKRFLRERDEIRQQHGSSKKHEEKKSVALEKAMALSGLPAGEGTKILCLDDDEMILNIMKHLLEANGYRVYTALDCSAIHDVLMKEDVRLVVSDVQMPGLPGTKVCRLLKKSIEDLKVILFSNIPEQDLQKFSEENKADGWISKSWKPAEWLEKIEQLAD